MMTYHPHRLHMGHRVFVQHEVALAWLSRDEWGVEGLGLGCVDLRAMDMVMSWVCVVIYEYGDRGTDV